MERKMKKLVVDTGAFLKCVPLWEYAEELYCVQEVINEIKDRQAKHFLRSLPVELILREPSSTALQAVIEFTRKSGDYASLSLADLKVLALTYDIEVEAKGSADHLRTEPIISKTENIVSPKCPLSNRPENIEGFYVPSRKKTQDSNEVTAEGESLNDVSTEISNEEHSNVQNSTNDCGTIDLYEYLNLLDDYLSRYSYIGGHHLSSSDLLIHQRLQEQYPILKKFADIFDLHRKGHNTNLLISLYRICEVELKGTTQKAGEELNSGQSRFGAPLDLTSRDVILQFLESFSQIQNFCRWFWHILSVKDTDTMDLTSTDDTHELVVIFDSLLLMQNHDFPTDQDDSPLEELSEYIAGEDSYAAGEVSDEREDTDEGYSCESDDDDDEGWITPSNIHTIRRSRENPSGEPNQTVDVACITVDYSMQNTLKHIGLSVLGVDGRLVKNVRTFIFRCYACFKTTDKMDLVFCPKCGNKTLKRVSVSLNPDGTEKIWISNRRPINIRGMRYSLPNPKGGKHAHNPILVADQRRPHQKPSRVARMKTDPMNENYDTRPGGIPFMTRDVYSKSAQLGIQTGKNFHSGTFYWEQKNPNVNKKRGTSRRKK